jgi:hypothetical protein
MEARKFEGNQWVAAINITLSNEMKYFEVSTALFL